MQNCGVCDKTAKAPKPVRHCGCFLNCGVCHKTATTSKPVRY